MHPAAQYLEWLIDLYGLPAILSNLSDVCDAKAHHIAIHWQDVALAKAWSAAQSYISEAHEQLAQLNL
jgi:hypothetical protein